MDRTAALTLVVVVLATGAALTVVGAQGGPPDHAGAGGDAGPPDHAGGGDGPPSHADPSSHAHRASDSAETTRDTPEPTPDGDGLLDPLLDVLDPDTPTPSPTPAPTSTPTATSAGTPSSTSTRDSSPTPEPTPTRTPRPTSTPSPASTPAPEAETTPTASPEQTSEGPVSPTSTTERDDRDGSATGSFAGGDSLELLDVELADDRTRAGQGAAVRVTVENTGERTARRPIPVELDGETVTTRNVTVGGGETSTVTLEFPVSESGNATVSVDGVEAGRLRVLDASPSTSADESTGGFTFGLAAAAFLVVSAVGTGLLAARRDEFDW